MVNMLNHIVLIKPKKETTERQLEDMCVNVKLLSKIPGVMTAHCRKNINTGESNGGYTYGITVVLEGYEDLLQYLDHPIHKEFARLYLRPIRESSIVYDNVE